jgi:TadE-like protein
MIAHPRSSTRGSESGQAAVEAAITLPLMIFVVLGTLQLFMMLHGRIMAEYAAYRATRAGSVNQGNCESMTHAAIGAVLPSFARTDDAVRLGLAFGQHSGNAYTPGDVWGQGPVARSGAIIWLVRKLDRNLVRPIHETFDDRTKGDSRAEIQVDLVYWYPLRIPFADWVMSRAFLASFGALTYTAQNPLMETAKAKGWDKTSSLLDGTNTLNEFRSRVLRGQYDFPIRTSFRMRMMTPAVQWDTVGCPKSPSAL